MPQMTRQPSAASAARSVAWRRLRQPRWRQLQR